eukprot:TRINITY_DN13226_c0_g1_i1.p1 TRINITY_DN13226_c0_g1~~TRINITY_DN13226_c0_g1_i1.p1  ORF type:complete len:84 (-),score=2.40 TRINITY_DN13226_c0_g1_i1:42-293(-)
MDLIGGMTLKPYPLDLIGGGSYRRQFAVLTNLFIFTAAVPNHSKHLKIPKFQKFLTEFICEQTICESLNTKSGNFCLRRQRIT